jgi:hypothetical protein
MYMGDHIVLSACLALVSAKRLNIPVVPLTSLLLLTNFIDIDHLIYYYLDDGTANSLILHPLHIYAGVLIFLLGIGGLIFKNHVSYFFCLMFGIALHLTTDTLAYWVAYNIPILLALGIGGILFFIYLANTCLRRGPKGLMITFMIGFWLLSHLELVITYYGLGMRPLTDFWFWVFPPIIPILAAGLFYFIFKNKGLSCQRTTSEAKKAAP